MNRQKVTGQTLSWCHPLDNYYLPSSRGMNKMRWWGAQFHSTLWVFCALLNSRVGSNKHCRCSCLPHNLYMTQITVNWRHLIDETKKVNQFSELIRSPFVHLFQFNCNALRQFIDSHFTMNIGRQKEITSNVNTWAELKCMNLIKRDRSNSTPSLILHKTPSHCLF